VRTIRVRIRRIGAVQVPLPCYQTALAAGMDLCAALEDPCELLPGERRVVPTGLALSIPEGYEGQVRPRSGLASRHGIGLVNAPGTIDADYRGEVRVGLINLSSEPYVIHPLDRIAQLVIAPVVQAELELTDDLDPTERGSGGYGSTGR
jgi:dUTP pyrophosphatase